MSKGWVLVNDMIRVTMLQNYAVNTISPYCLVKHQPGGEYWPGCVGMLLFIC